MRKRQAKKNAKKRATAVNFLGGRNIYCDLFNCSQVDHSYLEKQLDNMTLEGRAALIASVYANTKLKEPISLGSVRLVQGSALPRKCANGGVVSNTKLQWVRQPENKKL